MATIYLIRHGQASFGADDYDKLSDLGCRQARVVGEYLRDCQITFDAVYSGDLLRQRETARLAVASQPGEVPHHVDPRFNEIRNDEQLKYLVPEVVKTYTPMALYLPPEVGVEEILLHPMAVMVRL